MSCRLRLVAAIDPDVDDAAAALGADLLQLAGLEEAEEQALHAQRHLADFVEEDGALVGGLELAGLVAIGAGEAALDVAEELGLEERLGQTGAVDGDEGLVGARAVGVDGARDELLADAALAGDEDLGVGAGDALDLLAQLQHLVAGSNQLRSFGISHGCPWSFGRLGDRSTQAVPRSWSATMQLHRQPDGRSPGLWNSLLSGSLDSASTNRSPKRAAQKYHFGLTKVQ